MVFPEASPMRDGHEGCAQFLSGFVHNPFDLQGYGRGALVQDRELGSVVEKTGHGDALLEAAGEDVAPFLLCVPSAGAVDDGGDFDDGEDLVQVCVGDVLGAHFADAIWVDDLLAKGAAGEVWALGDVEDFVVAGFLDGAAVDGPEAAEDTEEG